MNASPVYVEMALRKENMIRIKITILFVFSQTFQCTLASSCPNVFIIRNVKWNNIPQEHWITPYLLPPEHVNGKIILYSFIQLIRTRPRTPNWKFAIGRTLSYLYSELFSSTQTL